MQWLCKSDLYSDLPFYNFHFRSTDVRNERFYDHGRKCRLTGLCLCQPCCVNVEFMGTSDPSEPIYPSPPCYFVLHVSSLVLNENQPMNQHKMEHVLSANPFSATESVFCTSNRKDERNLKKGLCKSKKFQPN